MIPWSARPPRQCWPEKRSMPTRADGRAAGDSPFPAASEIERTVHSLVYHLMLQELLHFVLVLREEFLEPPDPGVLARRNRENVLPSTQDELTGLQFKGFKLPIRGSNCTGHR